MRISPVLFGVLALAIFLGTIFGFQAAGIWSVSGKTTSDGQAVQPSTDDVNTIKGWMTLEQITTAYGVPLPELLAQFNLPADTPPTTALKDLESEVFSVDTLRTWLQSRQSSTGSESTAVPSPTSTMAAELVATASPTEHVAPEKTITGKTTFQNLLDWGLLQEDIEGVIGGKMPDASVVIKDYVTQQGLEFSPVKTTLQAEVDKTK